MRSDTLIEQFLLIYKLIPVWFASLVRHLRTQRKVEPIQITVNKTQKYAQSISIKGFPDKHENWESTSTLWRIGINIIPYFMLHNKVTSSINRYSSRQNILRISSFLVGITINLLQGQSWYRPSTIMFIGTPCIEYV